MAEAIYNYSHVAAANWGRTERGPASLSARSPRPNVVVVVVEASKVTVAADAHISQHVTRLQLLNHTKPTDLFAFVLSSSSFSCSSFPLARNFENAYLGSDSRVREGHGSTRAARIEKFCESNSNSIHNLIFIMKSMSAPPEVFRPRMSLFVFIFQCFHVLIYVKFKHSQFLIIIKLFSLWLIRSPGERTAASKAGNWTAEHSSSAQRPHDFRGVRSRARCAIQCYACVIKPFD